jgi:hypothetical protein
MPKRLALLVLCGLTTSVLAGPKNYLKMNFGPSLNWTYKLAQDNIAQKAIAVRLDDGPGGVSKGKVWMLFDHDMMRVAAGWYSDKFVDWRGIAFDGSHNSHTSIVGDRVFQNPIGPGWAKPGTSSFKDPRPMSRKDRNYGVRPYGPIPRTWAHYKGLYKHGNKIIIKYTVGTTTVHEMFGMIGDTNKPILTRTMNFDKVTKTLYVRVAPENVPVGIAGSSKAKLAKMDGFQVVRISPGATQLVIRIGEGADTLKIKMKSPDLSPLLKGGPKRWAELVKTQIKPGNNDPYAIDTLTAPHDGNNPWNSWMRLGGFDFINADTAAVCTWMGDVWLVTGIAQKSGTLTWKRIASGLFQPLGVKYVDNKIYVTCRDQLVRLHDLNGDLEIDFFESFNNDHQVTEHFHEFAMGLQTDKEGNFYYAKSARHAKPALVPHHGTLLKISKDGTKTTILATGFRAANGVCVNDDGSFFVTDQEGHWTPKNRINWVTPGNYYGNHMGFHELGEKGKSNDAMKPPLVWITNKFDRSPAELLWVTSDKWGPIKGSLLNLSYGYGKIYVVPHEKINGQVQGGVSPIPLRRGEFPTGIMRGRFHPGDGQLYACGLFSWAGSKGQAGGFYRVRYTGKPVYLPIGLNATKNGMIIKFSGKLNAADAKDEESFSVKMWDLRRAGNYGSRHYNEKSVEIRSSKLLADGKSVLLEMDLKKTWGMEIRCRLRAADGTKIDQTIHNTIHNIGSGPK